MTWLSNAVNWVGNQVKAVGNWVDHTIQSAWNWVSDNVSGAPLTYFASMATVYPSATIGGAKYFIPRNADGDVNAVLSGSKWSSLTITYSMPDFRSDYEWINPSASGYKRLSYETEQAFHYILKGYSSDANGVGMRLASVEGITNLVVNYAGRNDANIKLSAFTPGSIINRSHAYYPGVPVYGGDLWLTNGDGAAVLGSKQYYLMLHELGHALGLKHTHDEGPNLPKMSAAHDRTEYSAMSYNAHDYPQTYMMYDIAGLQEMYGANFRTNSGNTVYKWNPVTGETYVDGVSQGRPGPNKIFLTIWDGGGIDTYDLSNYSANAVVDLNPGGYSLFSATQQGNGAKGNVYNALQYKGDPRSLIENATTGAGNDQITGNKANNVLIGNAGNDTISGQDGNDTLNGGAGSDKLWGGWGNDRLAGGEGNDWIAGEGGHDVVQGGDGDDVVGGQDGNDRVLGDGGNDTVYGGTGQDTLEGGEGQDWLYGEDGDDLLAGGVGDDQMCGGFGNDWLYGNAGNDWIAGEGGDDIVTGGDGDDVVGGQDGNDRVLGEGGHDQVYGGLGNDTLDGGDGFDRLIGDEDWIAAGGADSIYGGLGNDVALGGAGNDTIDGGLGNDELWGGAGADRFRFSTDLNGQFNVDRIQDFDVAEDKIELDGRIFKGLYTNYDRTLMSACFKVGASATSVYDRIIYNSTTGELFYDADGSGSGVQVKFAELSKGLALTVSNFVLA